MRAVIAGLIAAPLAFAPFAFATFPAWAQKQSLGGPDHPVAEAVGEPAEG